ncbi:MAG TPA: CDP-alcohol phosphatidyltransferase family protein [Thermoplasmata archaeon]|nr:CDP-alcohol phosphatidyltransferase family protein [Thermoplasmata archaeon]
MALGKESAADALTLGNALSGFLAMTYVADGRFTAAALFIFLAALLDGLDGWAARRFGSRHDRGRFADAFADAISFCLAPALFLYALLYDPARGSAWRDLPNALAVVSSTLVAAFGLLRLMRFAEVDFTETTFRGLPTPANAIFLVSLSLLFGPTLAGGADWNLITSIPALVIAGALLSSALMITEVPYPKIGDGFRVFAAIGSAITVGLVVPTVFFGGLGTECTMGPLGCPPIELPLFAAALGILLAYIVGGPLYVRVGSRQEVVSVQ